MLIFNGNKLIAGINLLNEVRITRCDKSKGIYRIKFPPIRHFGTSLDGFEIRKKEQS